MAEQSSEKDSLHLIQAIVLLGVKEGGQPLEAHFCSITKMASEGQDEWCERTMFNFSNPLLVAPFLLFVCFL